jgi:prevent-host-death family protein
MTIYIVIYKDTIMGAYSVAEAKAQLSALLLSVERGEEVTITRRGIAVAVVSPVRKTQAAVNWERIRSCQQRSAPAKAAKPTKPATPAAKRDWAALVHAMRDE